VAGPGAAGENGREEVGHPGSDGSVIIPAREARRTGVAAALARIPAAERYFITLGMDGLAPTIPPAVGVPFFGGLAAMGRVVGFDLVELVPALDRDGRTARLAARLITMLLGALVRAGQIGVSR